MENMNGLTGRELTPPYPGAEAVSAGSASGNAAASGAGVAATAGPAASGEGDECFGLAVEGERRCRAGDRKNGVQYFQAALTAGTDDLHMLSAIYSQLGNAYFYLGDYSKALEYHRHDLTLARTIGDQVGEAKAFGNLGNTLKILGKLDQAEFCCQRHLDISKALSDKAGEGRAYYNLGNVYHFKLREALKLDNNSEEVQIVLQKAVHCYEKNIEIAQELGDRVSEGRAYGNLANTLYFGGDDRRAVYYHKLRLDVAKEYGDKSAMRRAYTNLGNCYVFLREYDNAMECFKAALNIAIDMAESAQEAQALYSLGNTSTLLGEHTQASSYHIRHLGIARQLKDKVGQARAYWSLGNSFTAMGDHAKALYFVKAHENLSREIGDMNGVAVAKRNAEDLRQVLGPSAVPDSSADSDPISIDTPDVGIQRTRLVLSSESLSGASYQTERLSPAHSKSLYAEPIDSRSAEQIELGFREPARDVVLDDEAFLDLIMRSQSKRMDDQRCDPGALAANKENRPRVRATDAVGDTLLLHEHRTNCPSERKRRSKTASSLRKSFRRVSLLRFGFDRRLSLRSDWAARMAAGGRAVVGREQGPDDFLDMIAGFQSRRMNDQRASLPYLPGLQHPAEVLGPHIQKVKAQQSGDGAAAPNISVKERDSGGGACSTSSILPDDEFFEMLMRCQGTRIDEQRSELPTPSGSAAEGSGAAGAPAAPSGAMKNISNGGGSLTVPDEDFFQIIVQMQKGRIHEQRAHLQPLSDCSIAANSGPEIVVCSSDPNSRPSINSNHGPRNPDDPAGQIGVQRQAVMPSGPANSSQYPPPPSGSLNSAPGASSVMNSDHNPSSTMNSSSQEGRR